jgi:hypothetical protein
MFSNVKDVADLFVRVLKKKRPVLIIRPKSLVVSTARSYGNWCFWKREERADVWDSAWSDAVAGGSSSIGRGPGRDSNHDEGMGDGGSGVWASSGVNDAGRGLSYKSHDCVSMLAWVSDGRRLGDGEELGRLQRASHEMIDCAERGWAEG